jgi:hypothetical protein
MQSLEERPNLTRILAAAQIVGGVLWVLHSAHEEESASTKLEGSSRRIA